MSANIEIPDEAVVRAVAAGEDAAVELFGSSLSAAEQSAKVVRRTLEVAAPFIVAAELERMAQVIDNAPYPYEELLHRAAELRGERKAGTR